MGQTDATRNMKVGDRDVNELVAGCSSRFVMWEALIQAMRATTMAEIGVWKGEFAKTILQYCELLKCYYMVDPWATLSDWNKPLNVDSQAFDAVYQEALSVTDFAASKRVVLRGRTSEVIDSIPDNSLDFVYIDGDHTLRGITIDLIKVFPKVKPGGFIGCDDFTPDPWQHNPSYEPTLVCPFSLYFAEAMGIPAMALPFNQCLMQKNTSNGFSFADPQGMYTDLSLNRFPPGLRFLLGELKKRVLAKLFN